VFNKLRKLSLLDIFVDFDLLWTIVLLEAAPSVEIFEVEPLRYLLLSTNLFFNLRDLLILVCI